MGKRKKSSESLKNEIKKRKINKYPSVTFHGYEMDTLISLKSDFKIERKNMRFFEHSEPQKNKYLTSEKQGECCVTIEDSFFSFPNGDIPEGMYNFCLTAELPPQLLCSKTLHHSYLANGKKVFGVGTLEFENGRLFKMSNHSGHYKPTNNEMVKVIKALYKASDEDLKVFTSYSKPTPETFAVLDILKQDSFDKLIPLANNEEVNIETGAIETITADHSDYDQFESILSNDSLHLKPEIIDDYQQQLCREFQTAHP
ncbi:hypothetical protein Lsan_1016 [Legionella santicrucis]|uniref:Uncharacterized protein n=2 Tax=Legionella santicrucis TaxID=45074 RepID=A0A0W0Z413_9GAMM|nr:hypothetical protein Lsan_1016 [Legionella santicrucis]